MPDKPRQVRVPDDLWYAAMAKAKDNGEAVADVVRRALALYVAGLEKR